jgi:phosphatidylserine/phosphatidylglycerophosphate/cardiolipin synthase-like enzyme
VQEVSSCVCDDDDVHVFVEGDALYDSMLADIAAARHEIGPEACIFADDVIGRQLVEALCERASAGARVTDDSAARAPCFGFTRLRCRTHPY